MAFRDLSEFLKIEPFVLPIRGKNYAFPGDVSALSFLRMQKLAQSMRDLVAGKHLDLEEVLLTTSEEEAVKDEMFGGLEAEMIADGLTSTEIRVVFFTLISYHLSGRNKEEAEKVWNRQGELPAPSRAKRRSDKLPTSARSRGSRAGSKGPVRRPASAGESSSSTGP